MTLTVRLPADLDEQLRSRAASQGVKVSDFVRTAIAEKLEREPARKLSAYELGKDVFGCYELGGPDDSTRARRKALIGEAIDAKHARRQRTSLRPVQQKRPASR